MLRQVRFSFCEDGDRPWINKYPKARILSIPSGCASVTLTVARTQSFAQATKFTYVFQARQHAKGPTKWLL